MTRKPTARPAKQPVRAIVVSDETEAQQPMSVVAEDGAAERKRTGVATRRATIARTMIYPGGRARESDEAVAGARPKPAAKSAAKSAVKAAMEPEQEAPESASIAPDVSPQQELQAEPAAVMRKRTISTTSRARLISRIINVIGGQLDVIEEITATPDSKGATRPETERHARTVATLARVVAELKKEQAGDKQRPADDDNRPRDLDELRERLSRRLAERIDRRSSLPVGDDAAGRDRLSE